MNRNSGKICTGLISLAFILAISLAFSLPAASPCYAEWAMTYNNEWYSEFAKAIQQTADGGYVVVGDTLAHDLNRNTEIWVLKLKGDGSIDWSKSYGVPGGQACCSAKHGYSIQQTEDGGYIVAGETQTLGNHPWILKLYPDGNIEWQRTYNWTFNHFIFSIKQTKDGGYIMAGAISVSGSAYHDFGVVKLHADGTIDWQKAYAGEGWELAYSIEQTEDEGYIVAGVTESFS